jgi:O-antigen/teichoic acid export membrane protein
MAQIYSQLVTVLVQLALVPVLLHSWGAVTYGTWLLISSIPAYLTMSDFGFTTVAKTMMVMRMAEGDRQGVLRCYHTVFVLVCAVAAILTVVCMMIVSGIDPTRMGQDEADAAVNGLQATGTLSAYLTVENRLALALLVGSVLIYQLFLLVAAAVRTLNRPAVESTYAATMRLAEAVTVGAVAIGGLELAAAAAAILLTRVAMTSALYLWTCTLSPWLRLSLREARWAEFRALRSPAAAFMAIPLSQAMLMQAPVIALGATMGPVAVAAFSTARTVLRVGCSAINMLNATFVTRYSVLAGSRQFALLRRLVVVHLSISAACVLAYFIVALLGGQIALDFLTGGKLHVGLGLLALIAGAICTEMIYTSALTALSATNIHALPSHVALALSVGSAALCPLAAHTAGAIGVATVVLCAQAAILVAILAIAHRRFAIDRLYMAIGRDMQR